MKSIKNYISVLGASLLLFGCTKDMETVTYNPADATPAVLEELQGEYVLTADEFKDVAVEFKWAEAQFGFDASVVNKLEMDVEGKEFAGAMAIASMGREVSKEFTHGDLNSSLMKLLESYGMSLEATTIEFRLASTFSDNATPLYSNVVSSKITPYEGVKQYPLIAIVGDYSGWKFVDSQKLYSAEENTIYSAMIAFEGKSANGWKVSELPDWQGGNWGSGEEVFEAEQSPITLFNDALSGNISVYSKNFYKLSFDTSSSVLTVEASYDTWGVVGQHNNWGNANDDETVTPDTPLALASETDDSGAKVFYLTANVDLKAGEGWKLRPNNTWSGDRGPGSFPAGEPANAGGNFCVDTDGTYAIRWYFNQVDEELVVIKLASSTPAELNALEASYTLSDESADNDAFTLSWAPADLSTSEAITNDVEMSIKGTDFANKIVLASLTDANELTIKQGELNFKILDLLKANEKEIAATDIEFRVYSSSVDPKTSPKYSNVVSTNITPYEGEKQYPSIALRGGYSSASWDYAPAQRIYSANSDDIYQGLIYFGDKAAEGWKLCETEVWDDGSWGLAGGETAEQNPVTLAGSSNIDIFSKRFYNFEFNKSTKELKFYESYDQWGIVGSHNGWGETADAEMTLASETAASGDIVYYLTATLDMPENGEWKLRADAQWESGARGAGSFAGGEPESIEGGNFIVKEAGNYTIKWYFNKVEQLLTIEKN